MNLSFAKMHPDQMFLPLLLHILPTDHEKDITDFESVLPSIKSALTDILIYAKEVSKPIEAAFDQYLLLLTEETACAGIVLRRLQRLNHFYESHYKLHLDLFWGYACLYEQLCIQCRYLSKQAKETRRGMPLCHNHFVINEIVEYLLEDPALSCDMLADKLVLRPDYLSKVFKQETGQELREFIAVLRMTEMKKTQHDL